MRHLDTCRESDPHAAELLRKLLAEADRYLTRDEVSPSRNRVVSTATLRMLTGLATRRRLPPPAKAR